MCRYAFHVYRDHHVCFDCRKMFRPHKLEDYRSPMQCPECRNPLHDMGRDFRPPKQANKKQWEKAKLLYSNGLTFHGCGCGSGPRVATLRDARELVESRFWAMYATKAHMRRKKR